jgi:HAD superfamily hydrolase (TIGR01509 family)
MKIKAALLDLGNVVLELDIPRAFQALGIEEPWEKLSHWEQHHLYETGKISTDEFIGVATTFFKLKLSREDFISKWNLIVKGVLPGVDELLAELSAQLPLHALSNTNPLHLEHYKPMKGMEHLTSIFASHELGYRKPDPAIYKSALTKLGLKPHEVLFVDDMPENVEAARHLGMPAEVCMTSCHRLKQIFDQYRN